MAKPMSTSYLLHSGETAFQPEHLLADTRNSSPIQADESKKIVEAADGIIRRYHEDSLRRLALIENRDMLAQLNGDLEADVDEPMTMESLAARHRRFLAANQQDWVGVNDNDNFSIVVSKIQELLKTDEDENPGAVKPTEYALSKTLDLLFETYELNPIAFPKASADTDESGGLHLYWRSPQRKVHLTISAHEEGLSFIYHSQGAEYDVEPNVSPANLAYWLNWYKEPV